MSFNPLEYPISLSKPKREMVSPWIEHVPFAMALVEMTKPRLLVELGTFGGVSYCAFCQAVSELGLETRAFAIDTWAGDEHGGYYGADILNELRAHHDPRYGAFSTLIQSTFDDALPKFADGSIDVLHIDGYHTYEAVSHDFHQWLPKMSERGVILFHDIAEHQGDFGVWRLWDEVSARYPSFDFTHGHGLGVIAVGTEMPPALAELLRSTPTERVAIRDYFQRLGEHAEADMSASAALSEARAERQRHAHILMEQYEAELAAERARAATERAELIVRHDQEMEVRREQQRAAEARLEEAQARIIALQRIPTVRIRSLTRAAGVVLIRKGPFSLAKHAILWIVGKRGYYLRDIREAQALALAAPAAVPPPAAVPAVAPAAVHASARARAHVGGQQVKLKRTPPPVKAIRLIGASWIVLIHKGPFHMVGHIVAWLGGKRGYYLSDIKTARARGAIAEARTMVTVSASPAVASASFKVEGSERAIARESFPGVSIIIPVFNALEYSQGCIESLYRVRSQTPFEVILINNGSENNVAQWLKDEGKRRANFRYVNLPSNLGFSKAMNLGMQIARGRHLVLLNSDTIVTDGWLDHLVAAADADPTLGVVSPMTNYVGNGPQIEEPARALPPDQAEQYARSIAHRAEIQYVPERLVFFCVLVPRQVVTLVGGLSDVYGLGNFEDDDYCLRTIAAGYKLGIARNSFVYHHGTKTFKANKIDHSDLMVRNHLIFLSRASALSASPLPAPWRTKMADDIEISVIMRTQNRPQTLETALTSLANQTFNRFEVVLVNDGGPDVSHVLRRFAHRLPIRYVRLERPAGAAAGLNAGLEAARGQWIAYLDDDDVVYPFHLEGLRSTLAETGAEFAYSGYNRVLMVNRNGNLAPVNRLIIPVWEFSLPELYAQDTLPIHTWMHSRSAAHEVGGFDTSLDIHEDWDFLLRMVQRSEFVSAKRISAEYRFYADSVGNSIVERRARSLELLEEIYRRFPLQDGSSTEPRDMIRHAIRSQIEQIAELTRLASLGKIPQAEAKQRMVSIVSGMSLDG